MQRDFILTFVYQNNQNMIFYSSTIKGSFFYLFLALSFTHSLHYDLQQNTLVYSQPRLEQIAQIMVR
jgi:hypothetical protein